MVSPISGVFNTTNLGPAIASIGNDLATYGRQSERRDWARELELMRESHRLELQRFRNEIAGKKGDGQDGDDWNRKPMTDEEAAALAGVDVPTYRSAAARQNMGARNEVKATVDTPGMEYLSPEDRDALKAKPMTGETPDSMAAAALGDRVRGATRERLYGPKNQKTRAEADTEDAARKATLGAPSIEASREGGERVGHMKGQGAFKGDKSATRNEFSGKTELTEIGRSEAAENRDQGAAQRALGRSRDRGQDTSTIRTLDQVEKEISKVQDLIKDYERDQGRKIQDPKSPQYQSYADAKERLASLNQRRDDILSAQRAGRSQADPDGPGRQTSKEDKFEVGKVYRDGKGRRAKYLGNGKWAPQV